MSEQLVEEWLKRAEDDELNIKSILKHRDGTPANACFLSHQVVEKVLKALLLFYSKSYPRTHDLSQLIELLERYIPAISDDFKEEVILLSPYYVGARYPADIPLESFTWKEAESASKVAQKIKEFALRKINKQ